MNPFSERIGYEKPKSLQLESMDSDLRNSLWNEFYLFFWKPDSPSLASISPKFKANILLLWINFMKRPIDDLTGVFASETALKQIRNYYFSLPWNKVYEFIEFTSNLLDNDPKFQNSCNGTLEREKAAYRFVSGIITPITSKEELDEIEKALNAPFTPVNKHIKCALTLFSDKENPDYRNSIKESISAVEALCKIIARDEKATLGQALNKIEKEGKIKLHPALKAGVSSIYGYTSDEKGIRHSLLDEDKVTLEDAHFMLVSCSAFINYMISKSSKAGIL